MEQQRPRGLAALLPRTIARSHHAAMLALLLGLCAAAASPADAARPATPQETSAIAAAFSALPECSTVTISEADPQYARWELAYDVTACIPSGNGFGIAYLEPDGLWRDIYQASDYSDPCPVTGLATDVGVELGACARPSRHVYVSDYSYSKGDRLVFKPARIPQGAHGEYRRLRWRYWDTKRATASGTLFYSDYYETFSKPIRIQLWRIGYCGDRKTYTRRTVSFVRAADRRNYRALAGTQSLGCPDGDPPSMPVEPAAG